MSVTRLTIQVKREPLFTVVFLMPGALGVCYNTCQKDQ